MSKKTKIFLAAAFSVSFLMTSCCLCEEETFQNKFYDEIKNVYALQENLDGSVTAKYDNGKSVTFVQEENHSLSFVSGLKKLLSLVAAGYLLSTGIAVQGVGVTEYGCVPVGARAATPEEMKNSRYSFFAINARADKRGRKNPW